MKRHRVSVLLVLFLLLAGARAADAESQPPPPLPADSPTNSPLLSLAEKGDAAAQYGLGVLYGNGDGGMEQNFTLAAHWFHKAATQGHAQAAAAVTFLEHAGLITPPSPAKDAAPDEPADEPALVNAALVQVATVGSEAAGGAEWKRQQRLYADTLGILNPVIHPFPMGEKVMYRVMGGPVEIIEARDLCSCLKATGGACHVVRVKSLSPPQGPVESSPLIPAPAP